MSSLQCSDFLMRNKLAKYFWKAKLPRQWHLQMTTTPHMLIWGWSATFLSSTPIILNPYKYLAYAVNWFHEKKISDWLKWYQFFQKLARSWLAWEKKSLFFSFFTPERKTKIVSYQQLITPFSFVSVLPPLQCHKTRLILLHDDLGFWCVHLAFMGKKPEVSH